MKSQYIKIYIFHLKKFRYKESILLLQKYILCYLKIFLNVILVFVNFPFFMKSCYIYIYFHFSIRFFNFIKKNLENFKKKTKYKK